MIKGDEKYGLARDLKEAVLGRQPKVHFLFLCFIFLFRVICMFFFFPLCLYIPLMFALKGMSSLIMGEG